MKVLYFASIREALDTDHDIVDLTDDMTVEAVRKLLCAKGEPWASVLSNTSLLAAKNQELVSFDTALEANDELAFMPPVTGG